MDTLYIIFIVFVGVLIVELFIKTWNIVNEEKEKKNVSGDIKGKKLLKQNKNK